MTDAAVVQIVRQQVLEHHHCRASKEVDDLIPGQGVVMVGIDGVKHILGTLSPSLGWQLSQPCRGGA